MGQRLNPFGVLQVVHLVRQDLSIAGKRAGLAGARSGLFMEQVRIVKEMRAEDKRNGRTGNMVRPRYLVWENVCGAYSSNRGRDFHAVLEEIARIAEPGFSLSGLPEKWKWTKAGAIDGDGWSIAWRTHDTKDWGKTIRDSRTGNVIRLGTPQRRRRISVVADFGGESAAQIQFDRESVSGDIAESGASGEGFAEDAESGFNPAVRDVTTYCLQGNGIDRADTAGCNGKGWREDSCYTLNTMHDAQAVMCEDVSHALRAKAACAYREDAETYPVQNMVVRRLTPLECTRLQGYPDGWVDIGDWTDEKGKKHKDADSPKYKALGNSIALPFWDWMLRRMARYLPEGATLGSLFDGIAGYPLIWERIHGKGTARWASEIEPFPIAVTKKWFVEE